MVPGERDGDASGAESALSLARILRSLKRHGSNLLVVGLTSEKGHGRVCGRMLGDDTAGPRRRLLVVTGADSEHVAERARHAQRPPTGTARYITYAASARSAADEPIGDGNGTTDSGSDNGDEPESENGDDDGEEILPESRHVEAGRLAELADAIESEIDAIEAENDGLVPAELRVCLDSLTPLLDAHDRDAVLRFLDRVTTRVKAAKGMGHVHLPVARDWDAVAEVEEPFDAVVELRVEQGRTQQRWHLRDADVTSDWFGV
jgi:hypothetical protein